MEILELHGIVDIYGECIILTDFLGTEYSLIDFPDEVSNGEIVTVKVKEIINSDTENIEVLVLSVNA